MKKYICRSCLNWFFSDIETENELVTCPCCAAHSKTVKTHQGIVTIELFKCATIAASVR